MVGKPTSALAEVGFFYVQHGLIDQRDGSNAVLSYAKSRRINFKRVIARLLAFASLTLLLTTAGWKALHAHAQIAVRNQGYVPFSDEPINYRSDDLKDPVALLQQKLATGEATLQYEPEHGYLKSVLKLLKVPIDSQALVFAKTSFQYKKISPEHPRALL